MGASVLVPPPIIVPVVTERDCVVVEGNRYCRDEDYNGLAVVGVLLFTVLLLVTIPVWMRALLSVWNRLDDWLDSRPSGRWRF